MKMSAELSWSRLCVTDESRYISCSTLDLATMFETLFPTYVIVAICPAHSKTTVFRQRFASSVFLRVLLIRFKLLCHNLAIIAPLFFGNPAFENPCARGKGG